ncbi:uncharacterized protein LODBEIA_P16300 [Lodderomyces beijingensis]|uniref:Uncharacterized protein n=1 Tax=Lodderomyces beijingensis TaxID=1775926 RepID=A0ABP0ZGV8_9ASCO
MTATTKSYKVFKKTPLAKPEDELTKSLKHYMLYRDTLQKAVRYTKEESRIQNLIQYWREVAQKASTYIYNEQSTKFARMGGFKHWQTEQWLQQQESERDRILETYHDLQMETKHLDPDCQGEIMTEFQEQYGLDEDGEFVEDLGDVVPVFSDDFQMRDLYRILGLDYDLVFD